MSPPPPLIVDLNSGGFGGTIRSRISEALQEGAVITPDVPPGLESISYKRTIPTEVMYSAKGLKLYGEITKLEGACRPKLEPSGARGSGKWGSPLGEGGER